MKTNFLKYHYEPRTRAELKEIPLVYKEQQDKYTMLEMKANETSSILDDVIKAHRYETIQTKALIHLVKREIG